MAATRELAERCRAAGLADEQDLAQLTANIVDVLGAYAQPLGGLVDLAQEFSLEAADRDGDNLHASDRETHMIGANAAELHRARSGAKPAAQLRGEGRRSDGEPRIRGQRAVMEPGQRRSEALVVVEPWPRLGVQCVQ